MNTKAITMGIRRAISGIVASAIALSSIPAMAAENEKYPYTLFAASSEDGAITTTAYNFCVNGNVCTNGTIVANGNLNVNGTKTENAGQDMIYIFDKIDTKYFTTDNVDEHIDDYVLDELNININVPTEVLGETELTGNININTALKSFEDINLCGDVKNTNDSVIFSKYGDIIIDSTNVNLNGLVYAPFGDVEITAQNLNLNNVVIIADSITLDCPNVNANYSTTVAEFVGNHSEPSEVDGVGELYFKKHNSEDVICDELNVSFIKNQILVTANDAVPFEDVERFFKKYNASVVGYIELTNDYQIQTNYDSTTSELLKMIDDIILDQRFEFASLNTVFELEPDYVPTDKEWSSESWSETIVDGDNWGVEAIYAMSAWDYKDQMETVKIGLIDNEFELNHDDLAFKEVWNNSTIPTDDHGTHVAGTMAATFDNDNGISGIAVQKELYAYSINGDTDINTENMLEVMEYKYAFALLIGNNVRVINVSLHNGREVCFAASRGIESAIEHVTINAEILQRFLRKLLDNGYDFVIVTSAGNVNDILYTYDEKSEHQYKKADAGDTTDSGNVLAEYNSFLNYPYDDLVTERVICTGAIENFTGFYGVKEYKYCGFSNVGARVDVVAPGRDIESTVLSNNYGVKFGTSMAAPHVAGIAGLLYSVNPGLSGKDVKEIIVNTSKERQVSDSYSNTYYIANAARAVERAITYSSSTPPVTAETGILIGRVCDTNSDAIPYAKISAYRIDSNEANVETYSDSMITNEFGEFDFVLCEGAYRINVQKDGFIPLIIYCDVISNETIYLEPSLMVEWIFQKFFSVAKGYVKDALTGMPIANAIVKYRNGWNNRTGGYVSLLGIDITSKTDEDGYYSNQLLSGNYTAEIYKDGYIIGYANIVASSNYESHQNVVLSPILPDNQYRIVLSWSSTPADLDSHLTGPTVKNSRFHVYYSNIIYSQNGKIVAELDIDDMNGNGPETVTMSLNADIAGVYRYSVHDYSNRSSSLSKMLSLSGARVRVYKGNQLIKTFNVPVNQTGTLWTVFELDNGVIKAVNTLTNHSSPGTIN